VKININIVKMLKKSDILDVMDVIFESEKNEKQNN
jgi:hypothetical protein